MRERSGPRASRYLGAYALAIFATLMWGGNSVIARASAGEVSPAMATWLRLSISSLAMMLILGRRLPAAWPALRSQWKLLLGMSISGVVVFNNLLFLAAQMTSASSIAIVQGAIPVFVLLGGAVFMRQALSARQLLGAFAGFLGVFSVAGAAGQNDVRALLGDGLAIVAMACYAYFILAVRRRQHIDAAVLFGAVSLIGWLLSGPLMLAECLANGFVMPTHKGLWLVAVSGFGASFAAQFAFLHAVDRLGASRAGLFMNFIPVFGVLLACLLLHEQITSVHAAGLLLVLGGIVIVEWQTSSAVRTYIP